MKRYLETVKKAIVTMLFAFIMLGMIHLLNIEFNGKRYLGIVLVSVVIWTLLDVIKIKRSR